MKHDKSAAYKYGPPRCLSNGEKPSQERPVMTHDELIIVARTHTIDFPRLTGEPWANQETLNKVTAVDTVVVSFENDAHPKKIMILLEKESGKFISSWLMPRNPR